MFDEDDLPCRANPLIFHSYPATLVSLASSAVAMVCWRHRLGNLYLDEIARCRSDSFFNYELSCAEIFSLPRRMIKLIDRYIDRIAEELENWWCHHTEFFDDIGYKMISKYFDFIVLDFNGNINYKSTARNIRISGKLSTVEEFRISCGYGLETDIERLWPLVSENDLFKDVNFGEHSTLYYWIHRMKNELNEVPGDLETSVEFRVLWSSASDEFNSWFKIEYFWERLNENEKSFEIDLLLSGSDHGSAKYLLLKLNQTQLDEAVKTYPSNILYTLAKYDTSNCNYASQAWDYMKDKITKYEFHEILYTLYPLAFCEDGFQTDRAASFIYEVWSTAPEDFRQHILNMNCEWYLNNLSGPEDCDMRWYGRDIRFLFDILVKSDSDETDDTDISGNFWEKNWLKVMLIATPSDLVNCLRIIWHNDNEEIEFFKKNYMMVYKKASASFDKFIESGLTDELIEYFKYCSSNDEESARKAMKDVIDSNLDRMHKFSYDALIKFNDFIDQAFSSSDLAEKFKRENILTRVESWYDLLNETFLNGVKNMFECFFSSDTDSLVECKRRCFEICKQNLTSGRFTSFYIREWQEFFLWCAPNEEELAKFKKSIPIDDVFNITLTKMINGEYVETVVNTHKRLAEFIEIMKLTMRRSEISLSTSPMNGFLLWYFEDIQAVAKFKQDKIYNYTEVGALVQLFDERDGSAIVHVLNWFFESDTEKIRNYCNSVGFLTFKADGIKVDANVSKSNEEKESEIDEDVSKSNEDKESEMDEDVSESNEDEESEMDEDFSQSNENEESEMDEDFSESNENEESEMDDDVSESNENEESEMDDDVLESNEDEAVELDDDGSESSKNESME